MQIEVNSSNRVEDRFLTVSLSRDSRADGENYPASCIGNDFADRGGVAWAGLSEPDDRLDPEKQAIEELFGNSVTLQDSD